MTDLGVYLHYPWCRKLCPYCDFAVEVGTPLHDEYLAAILAELDARAGAYAGMGRLVSIYFGGGTPSLWRAACIETAIDRICEWFDAKRDIEITLEANPTDCTDANLRAWRAVGVNRVSIGVQSLAADELVVLGRDHRFGDGTAALARTLAAGGFTVSCDFILGVPPGSSNSGRAAHKPPAWIAPITATPVDHLSVYELTIEVRTAFGQRVRSGRLVPLDEDALTDLYIATHDALTAAGFEHYEISSYARPGKRAVHNSLYWRGSPFLGLGVGAASLAVARDGSGERLTNTRRVADYLAGVAPERVPISAAEMAIDRAWLGLRTSDGVAESLLSAEIVQFLVDEGLADLRSGRVCPTLRGFLMADRIAARIVQAL